MHIPTHTELWSSVEKRAKAIGFLFGYSLSSLTRLYLVCSASPSSFRFCVLFCGVVCVCNCVITTIKSPELAKASETFNYSTYLLGWKRKQPPQASVKYSIGCHFSSLMKKTKMTTIFKMCEKEYRSLKNNAYAQSGFYFLLVATLTLTFSSWKHERHLDVFGI